jgi:hypothetical protein
MFFDEFLIINTIQYRTLPKAAMSVKKVGVQLERCKSMEIYFLEIGDLFFRNFRIIRDLHGY